MKSWYQSKKIWTAVSTMALTVGSYLNGDVGLSVLITALGAVLIAGIAAADWGKEAEAVALMQGPTNV